MKKIIKRLALHRETLRGLDLEALREPAGGLSTQFSCLPADVHPAARQRLHLPLT